MSNPTSDVERPIERAMINKFIEFRFFFLFAQLHFLGLLSLLNCIRIWLSCSTAHWSAWITGNVSIGIWFECDVYDTPMNAVAYRNAENDRFLVDFSILLKPLIDAGKFEELSMWEEWAWSKINLANDCRWNGIGTRKHFPFRIQATQMKPTSAKCWWFTVCYRFYPETTVRRQKAICQNARANILIKTIKHNRNIVPNAFHFEIIRQNAN